MSNKFLILIMVILLGNKLHAQESKFEIISSERYTRNYNINYLLDQGGSIVGTYEGYFYTEKPADLYVNYNNRRIPIQKPLGQFIAVPKADRFFNYGVMPGFYYSYNLELHLLKTDGSWIKNVGVIGHSPYAVAASSEGDFYAFVHVDYDSVHSKPWLKKIDKNGNIEWSIEIQDCIPQKVYISENSKIIAIVYAINENNSFITEFYDHNGKKIGLLKNSISIGGIEFINDKEFILIEGNSLKCYKLDKSLEVKFSETLIKNTFSNFPISLSEEKDYFILVSLSDDNKYLISAYSLANGKLIAEIKISEDAFWEPYRMAVFESKDKILLRTGKQLVKLQLNR